MKIVLLFTFLSFNIYAEVMSDEATFYRCYGQITQRFPDASSTLVNQVKNGTIGPIDACLQVLGKANFTANNNNRIGNTGDQEARNVVSTIQQMHFSFLKAKNIPVAPVVFQNFKEVLDASGPSLYFTKAFFTPNYKFSEVFKTRTQYESDRATNEPAVAPFRARYNGAATNKAFFQSKFGWTSFQFIEDGALYGVKGYTNKKITYNGGTQSGSVVLDRHWGGGVIGSYNYVAMNLQEQFLYKANNGARAPRKWSRSVLKDFMCRDLPVVRYSDVNQFVSNNASSLSFRQDLACLRCHATMDRIGGVVRNAFATRVSTNSEENVRSRFYHIGVHPTNQGAESSWGATADTNYYRRPLNGHLYYRTFDGKLIDKKVNGGDQLGVAIAELDDPYVCIAKKYYNYFTGINVNVDDITDPQYGRTLSESEIAHRNKVIELGKSLKGHQSLKKLLEEVIRTPQYRNLED